MNHRRSISLHNQGYNESNDIRQPSRTLLPLEAPLQWAKAPPEWARAPRLWAVARRIDGVEAFQCLVTKYGFSDMQLPVTRSTLSSYIKDNDDLIRRFMDKQCLVETKFIDLDSKDVPDKHFIINDAADTFDFQEELGGRGFVTVWKAINRRDGRIYAVKRSRRCSVKQQASGEMADFINEIKIMTRLDKIPARHDHLVNFHGSYTDGPHVGLIMSPVAEWDLLAYLNNLSLNPTKESYQTIRSMYGCLASVVQWLHSLNVKHKDIKSANILVSHGQIYLIDFGISRVYETKEKTNTEGQSSYTADYASLEVVSEDWKGLASDIFSLGRTFIDMSGTLQGESPDNIVKILQTTGSGDRRVCYNTSGLSLLLKQLRDNGQSADVCIVDCIESMMHEDPNRRIEACGLMGQILNAGHQFVGKCCRRNNDNDNGAGYDHAG